MLELLIGGFREALHPSNVLLILAGTTMGVFVGAMPGLSSAVGLAIILPFVFVLPPAPAMLVMVALYMAAMYGGSITAIAIGIPGAPPAVATTFDGYPLARKGQGGLALSVSILSSALGGMFGVVVLMLAFEPIARFGLAFGPAEYFALGVFGLSVVANMLSENVAKGLISVVLGLLFYVIGLDVLSGYPRFTFGTAALLDGVDIVVVLIGFFAIAEVFRLVELPADLADPPQRLSAQFPSLEALRGLTPSILRGSMIGTVIGAVPGAGATIASLVAWNEERRFSKDPECFGTGVLAGVAAPEAANNASVAAAMIPLLSLGIPGSASTAVLLGGLTFHGINPGPLLLTEQAHLVYTIYAGFIVATVCMLVVGLAGIPLWIRIIALPSSILTPLVLGISLVGSYSLAYRLSDVWMALFFGVLGHVMVRFGIPLVPAILGLVLGGMVETNYRRALAISSGDHATFLTHPISLAFLVLTVLSFAIPLVRQRLALARAARAERGSAA